MSIADDYEKMLERIEVGGRTRSGPARAENLVSNAPPELTKEEIQRWDVEKAEALSLIKQGCKKTNLWELRRGWVEFDDGKSFKLSEGDLPKRVTTQMSLNDAEKEHVLKLADGLITPENGMEKHFIRVVNGKSKACTPKEKNWYEYWQSRKDKPNPECVRDPLDIDSDPLLDNSGPMICGTHKLIKEGQKDRNDYTVSDSEKRGIIDRVKREITEIEHRTDLSNDQKVTRITHIACSTCAGVAIQPIPFADIFILTPIQGYFGTRIAAIRGVSVTESEAIDLIKEVIGLIGMGFIAQQAAIGVWKIITSGAGGLVTIPLVYALTYAIMKVIDIYYEKKSRGDMLNSKQMKEIFEKELKKGKEKSKSRQNEKQ